jgi:hypothetical protein
LRIATGCSFLFVVAKRNENSCQNNKQCREGSLQGTAEEREEKKNDLEQDERAAVQSLWRSRRGGSKRRYGTAERGEDAEDVKWKGK